MEFLARSLPLLFTTCSFLPRRARDAFVCMLRVAVYPAAVASANSFRAAACLAFLRRSFNFDLALDVDVCPIVTLVVVVVQKKILFCFIFEKSDQNLNHLKAEAAK